MALNEFQVAIVGAGPAGSASALSCKKNGLSIVLIDKADFPRDKVCGDGIPLKTFKILNELGLHREDFFKDGFAINKLLVYSPKNKKISYSSTKPDASTKSGCIPRLKFDNRLFEKAAEVSDSVYTQHKVIRILNFHNKKKLILRNLNTDKEIELISDIIIGADGANSTIARLSGLLPDKQGHSFDGLRCYYQGKKFDPTIHLFYDKRTLPGYIWVFPVAEDIANVGIMINKRNKKNTGNNIRSIFFGVLNSNPELVKVLDGAKPLDNVKGAPLPLGTATGARVSDNILLVGDAAAFINPITGGGIYYAVISAMKAAEASVNAIKNGNLSANGLLDYENWWRENLLPGFMYSDMLKRWFSSERLTSWFMNTASWFKPFANFFIMVYGRPLPKRALWQPGFWIKVFIS